jgi:hypothetical protein
MEAACLTGKAACPSIPQRARTTIEGGVDAPFAGRASQLTR